MVFLCEEVSVKMTGPGEETGEAAAERVPGAPTTLFLTLFETHLEGRRVLRSVMTE